MTNIIRNKLTIMPQFKNDDEKANQINMVAEFCGAMEDGVKKVISFTKISPKPTELIADSKEEDDWLLHNWGCRDKALNVCWISNNEIIFDTFWNPAIPIILKIAKNFPHICFSLKFASKRTGTKTGEVIFFQGQIKYLHVNKAFEKRAYEIAFELMPHLKAQYVYNQKLRTFEYDKSYFITSIEQNGFYKEDDGTVLIGCDDKQKPLFNGINDLPF